MVYGLLAADADAPLIDDPQATSKRLMLEERDHARYQHKNGGFVLARRAQYDKARLLSRG